MITTSEAMTRDGLSRKALRTQRCRGVLAATKGGNAYLVTASEMERYDAMRKAPSRFSRDDYAMKGKQEPGHRQKKTVPSNE